MSETIDFQTLCKRWGIALTGGIASGKSTIAESLRKRGYTVIDADQVSRLVVAKGSEGLSEIVTAFGSEILTEEGEMNRALMRQLVFQDSEKRLRLESIIHKRLEGATKTLLSSVLNQPELWFYEASLIFERKREQDFLEVWVAHCPQDVQIQRLMARDGSDRTQALAILAAQMPPEEKQRLATRTIATDCTRAELEDRITACLTALKSGVSR